MFKLSACECSVAEYSWYGIRLEISFSSSTLYFHIHICWSVLWGWGKSYSCTQCTKLPQHLHKFTKCKINWRSNAIWRKVGMFVLCIWFFTELKYESENKNLKICEKSACIMQLTKPCIFENVISENKKPLNWLINTCMGCGCVFCSFRKMEGLCKFELKDVCRECLL